MVHLFSVIGIEHEWNPRISAVLDIAVVEDGRISPHKCRNRLTTWKDAINDLNAFIKPSIFFASTEEADQGTQTWILV